jgi:hypothetical protein
VTTSGLAGHWQEETLASLVWCDASGVHTRPVKTFPRLAATIFATAAGFTLVGLGGAIDAQAQPAPLPAYHWCPGQFWDPGWGNNWEGGGCHDDFHRDSDGWDHSRDWGRGPDRGYDGRGPGGYEGHGPDGHGDNHGDNHWGH